MWQWQAVACLAEVSGCLVDPTAFKAAGTGDPRPAGSIPVHLRANRTLVGVCRDLRRCRPEFDASHLVTDLVEADVMNEFPRSAVATGARRCQQRIGMRTVYVSVIVSRVVPALAVVGRRVGRQTAGEDQPDVVRGVLRSRAAETARQDASASLSVLRRRYCHRAAMGWAVRRSPSGRALEPV